MTWKFTVAAAVATALGWFGLATPSLPPGGAQPPAADAGAGLPGSSAADIGQLAIHLRTRMHDAGVYREPSRNPFRFARGRPSPAARRPAAPAADTTTPAAPLPPEITLSGVAATMVDGVSRRTAILSTAEGVLLASPGDTVPPDYRVVTVEEDAVELVDGEGTTRRIRLRP
jgi:hypothetical protein